MMEDTKLFTTDDLNTEMIRFTLNEVYNALREKGYNPIEQLVGYIISGDPGYISSYKDSRKKILKIDRSALVAIVLKEYLK